MRTRIDRRELLIRATGAATAALWAGHATAQEAKTKLILLGTGGGPRPRKASSAPAQVIVTNGTPYVVDCGDGIARQLVFANVPLPALRHIFLTHHHSDHNADYGNLIWLAWAAGLRTRVDTWGPPPLEKMTKLFFEMNASDIKARITDEGRVPLVPLVHVHELNHNGEVMRDENVTVTAALVNHPPVVPAFSYRFDARDRSIVISGDTARSDNLVKLARGADVLVHTAVYLQARSSSRACAQCRVAQAKHHRWPNIGGGRRARSPSRGRQDAGAFTSRSAGRSGCHRSDVGRCRSREFRRAGHCRQGSDGDLRNLPQPIIRARSLTRFAADGGRRDNEPPRLKPGRYAAEKRLSQPGTTMAAFDPKQTVARPEL